MSSAPRMNFKTADICGITDTLAMARDLFPGKRNNLDVLCDRYGIARVSVIPQISAVLKFRPSLLNS